MRIVSSILYNRYIVCYDSYSPSGSTEIVIFFLAAEIYCDLGALAWCMPECANECGIDDRVMSITPVIVVQF